MKYKRILYDEIIASGQISDVLVGKIVMVIGAGSGIGQNIAVNAYKAGAKVILVGRTINKLHETAQLIKNSYVVTCDISKEIERKKILTDIESKYNVTPNIIINCAGVRSENDKNNNVEGVDEQEWEKTFGVNYRGNVGLVFEFERKLRNSKINGKYIAISSIDGTKASATPYGLSKACLNSCISDVADTLQNCILYAIAPGPTATPMMDETMQYTYYRLDHPDLRCAVTQDISNVAVFLCTDTCKVKKGTVIKCDGGVTL